MVNFADALDTRVSDVEAPANLPQGTYIWTVAKVPSITDTKSGDWTVVEFQIKAVSAEDDVDSEELEAYGALTSTQNRIAFMAPTDPSKGRDRDIALNRIKKFLLNTLRIEADDNTTLKELMAQSVNCQFLGQAVWRQDGDDTYVDVKNYAPLD